MRRCHRGVTLRTQFMGFDPGACLAGLVAFALALEVTKMPFVAILVAAAAAWGLQVVQKGRLPGALQALSEYLRCPMFSPALGSDSVPRFPVETISKEHHGAR